MLQISQTENPICSATIDQMRLRRAMNLPFEFQNVSSSGFQSEIQVGSFEFIRNFLFSMRAVVVGRSRPRHGGAFWEAQSGGHKLGWVLNGFDGVSTYYSSFVPSCPGAKIR